MVGINEGIPGSAEVTPSWRPAVRRWRLGLSRRMRNFASSKEKPFVVQSRKAGGAALANGDVLRGQIGFAVSREAAEPLTSCPPKDWQGRRLLQECSYA